jgi:hypothetical protein
MRIERADCLAPRGVDKLHVLDGIVDKWCFGSTICQFTFGLICEPSLYRGGLL